MLMTSETGIIRISAEFLWTLRALMSPVSNRITSLLYQVKKGPTLIKFTSSFMQKKTKTKTKITWFTFLFFFFFYVVHFFPGYINHSEVVGGIHTTTPFPSHAHC